MVIKLLATDRKSAVGTRLLIFTAFNDAFITHEKVLLFFFTTHDTGTRLQFPARV